MQPESRRNTRFRTFISCNLTCLMQDYFQIPTTLLNAAVFCITARSGHGLAALISKLKPGGFIKIGLYSKLARKIVTAAWELIKSLGIQSTPEGIRDFRKRIFNDDQHELKNLSTLVNGFYALSECRDRCFHVQEHQFTRESLQKLLEAENLEFCGFMVPEAIRMAYQRSLPGDTNGTSMSNWGELENNNPSTFQSMYQYWAYKPL